MTEIHLPYKPQDRQRLLHETWARQVFFGGAAGGGKSHSLRWDAIGHCLRNPGLEAYLFRRTLPELESNHIRVIQREIPKELGEYKVNQKRFQFYNGSGINFCYCEREEDVTRYQGAEMHWLGVDEASHLTEFQLTYLRSRVRLGGFEPKTPGLPRIIFSSNPGGPGHQFLKTTFIDQAPAETVFEDKTLSAEGIKGWDTVYIPARMQDNAFLDPSYAGQFSAMSPELAKALRDGDWDAVVGQALHLLSREKHMIRPFRPPRHWTRFMCMDWGMASPFSIAWYCVSDGAELRGKEGDVWLPSGAVIMYREWYGWNGHANQGCRLPPQAVAKGIVEREKDEVMDYRVADSEIWAQKSGPSVHEWMVEYDPRLIFRKSVKDRKRNYQEVLARLAGNTRYLEDGTEEEDPMFFVTSDCLHFWRTCPVLTLDNLDPEKGPETKNSEDHVYDNVAYALRSRPYVTTEEDRFQIEFGDEIREAQGHNQDPYA